MSRNKNKIRILYISHLHPPKNKPLENVGGMQSVSVQMTDAIRRREDVEMETIILHSSWKYNAIKTFFFLNTLLWRIPGKVKNFKPDVVLFSSMVTAGVLPFLIKKPPMPCVTINHGQDVTLPFAIYQWYVPHIFNNLQGVISVSSATREASIQRGMNPDIGVALPNGYDASVQHVLPEKEAARKILKKHFDVDLNGKKMLLTVGRQVKRKGHKWFIENVIKKIKTDIVYFIVGDGPEHKTICRAREQSSMKEKIIITGKLPSEMLNTCYAAADLFVMPNLQIKGDMEGFGIVLLEANRSGVPSIASDLEGIKDVIEQGVNGYRVPSGDADMFARKIDYVIKNELEELSAKSKSYVLKMFNWDTVVDKYIRFLRNLN